MSDLQSGERALPYLRTFAALALAAGLAAGASVWLKPVSVYSFAGVRGPATATELEPAPPVRVEDYAGGANNRLAVMVTDPESAWLGLARGLRAHGIPFTMTQDLHEALRHRAVLVYPIVSGRRIDPAGERALAAHVHGGGSLLAFDVESAGLQPLFGVTSAKVVRHARTVWWSAPPGDPDDAVVRVSAPGTEAELSHTSHSVSDAEVSARFDDNAPAISCRSKGGRACVMGVDLGMISERAMNGRAEPIARAYVNRYEPSLDALYDWVAHFYTQAEPQAWLLGTAPAGRRVSIVLTHDLDYTKSVRAAVGYADLLSRAGKSATFFMQTKYVRDFNDDVFFTRPSVETLKRVQAQGFEIASHTVAHSAVMKAFPLGTGAESYPQYRPFVQDRRRAEGGTIFGEVRVSKFLLSNLIGSDVVSFRSGHLSNPFRLPDVLAAEGYRYDSSITADSCLTHLPFQLTSGRADNGLRPVYEFPVTIEDEEPPRLVERQAAADALISKIAAHGGVVVVLIHPDVNGQKLAFEEHLLRRWRDDAWMGSMRSFGDWWRARDRLQLDVAPAADGIEIRGAAPDRVDDTSIILPSSTPGEPSHRTVRLEGLHGAFDMRVATGGRRPPALAETRT